jgi:hypothetical protein
MPLECITIRTTEVYRSIMLSRKALSVASGSVYVCNLHTDQLSNVRARH